MKKNESVLELPTDLFQRLTSLANAEQVAVPTLLERMVASHRTPRPVLSMQVTGGTILGEAVAHEEIHVWDRAHDDAFPAYMGDYAD